MTTVAIVDYGIGNRGSVLNAVRHLGYDVAIAETAEDIRAAGVVVLPGVGAFAAGMRNLESRGLRAPIEEAVLGQAKPFLGICLGMQLIARSSEEEGHHKGLGWLDAEVHPINPGPNLPLPHVGWNSLSDVRRSSVCEGIKTDASFYFDHSFAMRCEDRVTAARCEYGSAVVAVVEHRNIVGIQFHPERSQLSGLRLLRRFFERAGAQRANTK